MKTISVQLGGWVFRWRGGSFVAVWRVDHVRELVPDDVFEVPASINRTHAGATELWHMAADYVQTQRENK